MNVRLPTPRLLGLQVGCALPLRAGERDVLSGIRKTTATGRIAVAALGLAGDEQADLSVHGGLAKAVYAYPIEHYSYWQQQARAAGRSDALPMGTLGENLTLQGLLESDVYVGDLLRFADCVLRVTQPRRPCFKFVAVMNDAQAARKMTQTGYCGFYLAVDVPGTIASGDTCALEAGPREVPLVSLVRPGHGAGRQA